MQLTGSQVIIECLKEQGVDTVFGYPGGAILNVYDELYKHPEIKHVLTSHEQGASHAADGYARSTGKVGVCLATSGRVRQIWSQEFRQHTWIRFQSSQSHVMSESRYLERTAFRR